MSDEIVKEYEFNEKQNVIIKQFTQGMMAFAITSILVGIVYIVIGLISNFDAWKILTGITWGLMGASFYFPIDNFQNIVKTEGSDINELMVGLGELRLGWAFVILLLLINRMSIINLLT